MSSHATDLVSMRNLLLTYNPQYLRTVSVCLNRCKSVSPLSFFLGNVYMNILKHCKVVPGNDRDLKYYLFSRKGSQRGTKEKDNNHICRHKKNVDQNLTLNN